MLKEMNIVGREYYTNYETLAIYELTENCVHPVSYYVVYRLIGFHAFMFMRLFRI